MNESPSRLDQLGTLLAAAILVAFTGSSNLTRTQEPIDPRIPEMVPHGFYSRVARTCGISPSACRRIALGDDFSKGDRVKTALIEELDRLESEGRLVNGRTGKKKYPFGSYSRIARKLGVTPQHVQHVALGMVRSARVQRELDALREEASL